MDNHNLQIKYFTSLREKYKIGQEKIAISDSLLYLILRKAELGIQISKLEFQWLEENNLFQTIEIISLQEYQAEDFERLESEFLNLKLKYKIPEDLDIPISSPVYSILWKVEASDYPTDSEFELLSNYELIETVTLIQNILNFSNLKISYKATQNLNSFPEEPLYSILQKLDERELLSEPEAEWLLDSSFEETLEIYWQQESERKEQLKFLELKSKFQVESYPDSFVSSPLYSILKKLDVEEELNSSALKWLRQNNLNNLLAIDRSQKQRKLFVVLKEAYKATQYESSDPSSPLYYILLSLEINRSDTTDFPKHFRDFSNTEKFQISEKDIQWLLEQKLIETAKIAQIIHFKILKRKYQIVGELVADPFYEIMLKLEREERLDPKQVIQLIEENRLYRHGKIATAHYRLEARFYEQEYKRTGNRWNLPTASSNWRKADEPQKALKATESINWRKVREPDLKAALCVTRGAAFRDIKNLDEAENCATQAMECKPDDHQPYTLMGAICYDRGEYSDGEQWFEMAEERGANNTDDEIERIVRMIKDKNKRREIAEDLLKRDPVRYSWASTYLK